MNKSSNIKKTLASKNIPYSNLFEKPLNFDMHIAKFQSVCISSWGPGTSFVAIIFIFTFAHRCHKRIYFAPIKKHTRFHVSPFVSQDWTSTYFLQSALWSQRLPWLKGFAMTPSSMYDLLVMLRFLKKTSKMKCCGQ